MCNETRKLCSPSALNELHDSCNNRSFAHRQNVIVHSYNPMSGLARAVDQNEKTVFFMYKLNLELASACLQGFPVKT